MVLFLGGTENVKQTLGAVGKTLSEGQDSCGAICWFLNIHIIREQDMMISYDDVNAYHMLAEQVV